MLTTTTASTMFPAVKYRAIDYVYEASTRQKLTMNWLVLPVPYHLDRSDLYAHSGTLPEAVYRMPWTRGTVISTCKLVISGSVLDDLKNSGQRVDLNEKFGCPLVCLGGVSVEVVPSSNPASQSAPDMGEALWLMEGGGREAGCAETFPEASEELLHPGEQPSDSGLYLKEEMLFIDHLLRFGEQLPRLRAILGRLKTVTVPDPLLCPAGNGLSEDLLFRHCLPFEEPCATEAEHHGLGLQEEFCQVPVLQEEALMLPLELESRHSSRLRGGSLLQELQQRFNTVPEQPGGDPSILELLRKDVPSSPWDSVEMSDFRMPEDPVEEGPRAGPLFSLDRTHPGHYRLYPQLETDLTLTPPRPRPRPPPQTQLSSAALPVELMSPVYKQRLVSDSARESMEEAVWKAEKHLPVVLSLLLAEPQMPEPPLQHQRISEAFKLMAFGAYSSVPVAGDRGGTGCSGPHAAFPRISPAHKRLGTPGIWAGEGREFVEKMDDAGPTEPAAASTEEFPPFSFCQIDNILRKCSEDTGCPGYPVTPTPVTDSPTPIAMTDALGSSCQEMQKADQRIATEETATNQGDQGAEPVPVGGIVRGGNVFSVQEGTGVHMPIPARRSVKAPPSGCPVSGPGEDLDPLASFMMLRSQQKAGVAPPPQNSSCTDPSKPEPSMVTEPKEELNPSCVTLAGIRSDVRAQETSRAEAREDSQVICVQASESQRRAYRLLHAAVSPSLSSAHELGLFGSAAGDFSALSPDHARFLLKQQEKELSASGRPGEPSEEKVRLYRQVALIHLLVTVRELLLQCDLSTAIDYLARAREAGPEACLGRLWVDLRVVQYLSQRSQEPLPKITALQEHLKAWMQENRTQRPCPKALVITTLDCDRVRALLVQSLSQIAGAHALAVCPAEGSSKLDTQRLRESVQRCRCLVVCGQHIGPDFPWHCFSLAVEFEWVGAPFWAPVCRERSVSHVILRTTVPCCEADPADPSLDQDPPSSLPFILPFTLLVTDSLLHSPLLLQTLESTYNMTVLERDFPHSLKMLGGTSRYCVITVDESTAVLIQELEELETEQASESFVLRMTALSLQYSCCWVLFYCPGGQGSGYSFSSEVFSNLVLISSSFVLFGLKSEDLDVKVLIVAEASHLARCIQRISHQTLLSSGRDPLAWLDRDWLSVLPSEEEQRLTLFPSVSPLVAQLMLRRAPGLQWLLGATLSELQELLPEVPHKVLKLFSDITALYQLNVSHSPPESPATAAQNAPSSPWGVGVRDPRDDPELFGADLIGPFAGPEDLAACGSDEDVLDLTGEAADFSGSAFLRDGVCRQWGGGGRFMALPQAPAWSVRDAQSPPTGNTLQGRPAPRNASAPWQSGGASGQTPTFSGGFTAQQTHYTPATYLAPPTSAGSQWNGKASPCGRASRPNVGAPCGYRGEPSAQSGAEGCVWGRTGAQSGAEGCVWGRTGAQSGVEGCVWGRTGAQSGAEGRVWGRTGQKRGAYAHEQDEWRADFPQLKKGKLTYEKVPGRRDGQTRLTFF
ncbi:protein shortage in chiasmata 1 ortholog isoform X2 [Anguilla anguilla]|uniref:protein shortage in chiasmata 1 ortholog isoform X2 n=1 Tax=Anguilla anguilla TaxID=7936 RepID=UPI0015A87A58|nr:protein shortage in chiasmata 1 ortholog isoform X2 [Anguilla anguilla]